MANEFDVVATNGQGTTTIWGCRGCSVQISAQQKPRSHVCLIPENSGVPQQNSVNREHISPNLSQQGPGSQSGPRTPVSPASDLQNVEGRPANLALQGYPFTPAVGQNARPAQQFSAPPPGHQHVRHPQHLNAPHVQPPGAQFQSHNAQFQQQKSSTANV